MRILLKQDTRTEIVYNEVIGKTFKKLKKDKVIIKKLMLYDTMDELRKQKVRLKVKKTINKNIIVEVI